MAAWAVKIPLWCRSGLIKHQRRTRHKRGVSESVQLDNKEVKNLFSVNWKQLFLATPPQRSRQFLSLENNKRGAAVGLVTRWPEWFGNAVRLLLWGEKLVENAGFSERIQTAGAGSQSVTGSSSTGNVGHPFANHPIWRVDFIFPWISGCCWQIAVVLTANVLLLWFKPGDWFWYLHSFDYNQIEKLEEMIKERSWEGTFHSDVQADCRDCQITTLNIKAVKRQHSWATTTGAAAHFRINGFSSWSSAECYITLQAYLAWKAFDRGWFNAGHTKLQARN